MQVKFVHKFEAKTKKEVKEQEPWAEEILKVDGGWMVFECWSDVETWRNQK